MQSILLFLSSWLDVLVPIAVFMAALAVYFQRGKLSLSSWSKKLIWVMIIYYPVYALINTVAQYDIWATSSDKIAQYFANAPLPHVMNGLTLWYDLPFMHTKFGYLIFYSWGRFWLGAVLALASALAFWLLLKALQRYKDRFFEEGEVGLGALTALLVGWPGFVIFIPLVFIAVAIVSVFRMLLLKETYTTLGAPMLFAVLMFYIFGSQLLLATGFQALKP